LGIVQTEQLACFLPGVANLSWVDHATQKKCTDGIDTLSNGMLSKTIIASACVAYANHNSERQDIKWNRDSGKSQGCQDIQDTLISSAIFTFEQTLSIKEI
jgi:hypothetical protein